MAMATGLLRLAELEKRFAPGHIIGVEVESRSLGMPLQWQHWGHPQSAEWTGIVMAPLSWLIRPALLSLRIESQEDVQVVVRHREVAEGIGEKLSRFVEPPLNSNVAVE